MATSWSSGARSSELGQTWEQLLRRSAELRHLVGSAGKTDQDVARAVPDEARQPVEAAPGFARIARLALQHRGGRRVVVVGQKLLELDLRARRIAQHDRRVEGRREIRRRAAGLARRALDLAPAVAEELRARIDGKPPLRPRSFPERDRAAAPPPDRRSTHTMRSRPDTDAIEAPVSAFEFHGVALPEGAADLERLDTPARALIERDAGAVELLANGRCVSGRPDTEDEPAFADTIDSGDGMRQEERMAQGWK